MRDPDPEKLIAKALEIAASRCDVCGGAHHKQWVIDQMVRALTNCLPITTPEGVKDWAPSRGYSRFIAEVERDGGRWGVGIAP